MPIISLTSFSKLSDRFDAEYFQPEYIELDKAFERLKSSPNISVKTLKDIARIRGSAFYGSIKFHYSDSGMPFIRVADIKELSIDRYDLVYLPKEFEKYGKQIAKVYSNWIVLSKSGTIGSVGIVPEDIPTCRISRDVLGIKPDAELSTEFLAVFLASKYGQLQFERFRSQQVQPHLEIKKVNEVLVTVPSKDVQKGIAELVRRAREKAVEAKRNYEEAEGQLVRAMGIQSSEVKRTRFKVNFKQLADSFGWSAESLFPEYADMIDAIKNKFPVIKFEDAVLLSEDRIEPEKQPTEHYKYVDFGNVTSFGNIAGFTKVEGYAAPSRARMLLRKGDVLIPYLTHSISKIGIVTQEYDGCIGSSGFFVARPKRFDSWFLFALLKNPIFQSQLQQRASGTILSSIPRELIKDIVLPVIPQQEQDIISQKMKSAFSLRTKGLSLIDEAIRRVEQLMNEYSLIGSR